MNGYFTYTFEQKDWLCIHTSIISDICNYYGLVSACVNGKKAQETKDSNLFDYHLRWKFALTNMTNAYNYWLLGG
jgi:hypothetical protein